MSRFFGESMNRPHVSMHPLWMKEPTLSQQNIGQKSCNLCRLPFFPSCILVPFLACAPAPSHLNSWYESMPSIAPLSRSDVHMPMVGALQPCLSPSSYARPLFQLQTLLLMYPRWRGWRDIYSGRHNVLPHLWIEKTLNSTSHLPPQQGRGQSFILLVNSLNFISDSTVRCCEVVRPLTFTSAPFPLMSGTSGVAF